MDVVLLIVDVLVLVSYLGRVPRKRLNFLFIAPNYNRECDATAA